MRVVFDHNMRRSNEMYRLEQEAAEVAKRLQLENDGLLELLLQHNEADVDRDERGCIDIHRSIDGVTLPPLPPKHPMLKLIPEGKEAEMEEKHAEAFKEYREACEKVMERAEREESRDKLLTRGLADLMRDVPHAQFEVLSNPPSAFTVPNVPPSIAKDLELAVPGRPDPVAYLSEDRVNDFLAQLDEQLGFKSLTQKPKTAGEEAYTNIPPHLTDRELEIKNPVSVYNWLRTHEPKIFLQDGEPASLKEQAASKPGALRGAGKRAVLPAPSRHGEFEIVEEDGLGYDTSIGVVPHQKSGGKRKRVVTGTGSGSHEKVGEDDTGYRPKGGSSRPSKKKPRVSSGGKRKSVPSKEVVVDEDVEIGEESIPAAGRMDLE